MDKATIKEIVNAIDTGICYARSFLASHDEEFGRTVANNAQVARGVEKDIKALSKAQTICAEGE